MFNLFVGLVLAVSTLMAPLGPSLDLEEINLIGVCTQSSSGFAFSFTLSNTGEAGEPNDVAQNISLWATWGEFIDSVELDPVQIAELAGGDSVEISGVLYLQNLFFAQPQWSSTHFQIFAEAANGHKTVSINVEVELVCPPTAVILVDPKVTGLCNTATVSWRIPVDIGGIQSFDIFRREGEIGAWVQINSLPIEYSGSFSEYGLVDANLPLGVYWYFIRINYSDGTNITEDGLPFTAQTCTFCPFVVR